MEEIFCTRRGVAEADLGASVTPRRVQKISSIRARLMNWADQQGSTESRKEVRHRVNEFLKRLDSLSEGDQMPTGVHMEGDLSDDSVPPPLSSTYHTPSETQSKQEESESTEDSPPKTAPLALLQDSPQDQEEDPLLGPFNNIQSPFIPPEGEEQEHSADFQIFCKSAPPTCNRSLAATKVHHLPQPPL